MIRIIFLIVFASLMGILNTAEAQRFNAAAMLGFTASQIDGDNLAGFSKLGLTGGLRLTTDLKEDRYFTGFELIYSQRGSQSKISLGNSNPVQQINLSYIEIPIIFGIKDWYIDTEDYYKVGAIGGLSYGYLFNASSNIAGIESSIDDFKTNDISWLLGVYYQFNKRYGMEARYTRSLTTLYDDPNTENTAFKSYFWTFRFLYNL